MKNGLILFAAIHVFIFLICPIAVISRGDNWVGRCISEYHSILGCAAQKFDSQVPVDPQCCKIIDNFDRTCVSKSRSFERLEHSFQLIKNRCEKSQASPNPPPSPTPSPPPPSSSSSTPPLVSSKDQTPWQRLQVYPPEPLPMPDATGLQGTWRGCGKNNAAEASTRKDWDFPNNLTSCILTRYIGIYCDTGKPLDTVLEYCCTSFKDPHADPVGKCMFVKPLIAPPGQQSPPSSPTPSPPPPPQTPVSVVPPEPLPVPDASGLWGQWVGCGEGNAAEKSVEKCWDNKDKSRTCCGLGRHIGISCETGKPFDTLHEFCCLLYTNDGYRPGAAPGKCMFVKPYVTH